MAGVHRVAAIGDATRRPRGGRAAPAGGGAERALRGALEVHRGYCVSCVVLMWCRCACCQCSPHQMEEKAVQNSVLHAAAEAANATGGRARANRGEGAWLLGQAAATAWAEAAAAVLEHGTGGSPGRWMVESVPVSLTGLLDLEGRLEVDHHDDVAVHHHPHEHLLSGSSLGSPVAAAHCRSDGRSDNGWSPGSTAAAPPPGSPVPPPVRPEETEWLERDVWLQREPASGFGMRVCRAEGGGPGLAVKSFTSRPDGAPGPAERGESCLAAGSLLSAAGQWWTRAGYLQRWQIVETESQCVSRFKNCRCHRTGPATRSRSSEPRRQHRQWARPPAERGTLLRRQPLPRWWKPPSPWRWPRQSTRPPSQLPRPVPIFAAV
jgi:hypothetical protein